MIWAIKNQKRILASPKDRATCELCNDEVISKCGEIKIWHWAHKKDFECDSFGEPESKWHIQWKNYFPKSRQEFRFEKHIADIYTKNRLVIELQKSTLSPKKIREREEYYKNMIWILHEKIGENLELRNKKGIITFRWKWAHKSWFTSKMKIYFDFWEDRLFLIEKIYDGKFCGGWGRIVDKAAFIIEHGGKTW